MSSSVDTRLSAARLFAIQKRPYYASALLALDTVEHHRQQPLTVDQRGRIIHNASMTVSASVDELATRLVHGLEHLLRDHPGRSTGAVARHGALAWQTASDLEINDDLGDFELPVDMSTPTCLGLPEGLLAEQYAELIDSGHSGDHARSKAPEQGACVGGLPFALPSPGPDEPGLVPARIMQLRAEAADAVTSHRGRVPAGVDRWATASSETAPVDWRRVLRQRVRDLTAFTAGHTDHDRRRVSRRSPHPFLLLPRLVDPVVHPAVVIDTSGSMSTEQLGVALDQVEEILRACGAPTLPVISCDSAVHKVKHVGLGERPGHQPGGGGSDMTPGIEQALSERADLVVVITDGWVRWPARRPRVPVVALIVDHLQDAPPGPDWLVTIRAEIEPCSL